MPRGGPPPREQDSTRPSGKVSVLLCCLDAWEGLGLVARPQPEPAPEGALHSLGMCSLVYWLIRTKSTCLGFLLNFRPRAPKFSLSVNLSFFSP